MKREDACSKGEVFIDQGSRKETVIACKEERMDLARLLHMNGTDIFEAELAALKCDHEAELATTKAENATLKGRFEAVLAGAKIHLNAKNAETKARLEADLKAMKTGLEAQVAAKARLEARLKGAIAAIAAVKARFKVDVAAREAAHAVELAKTTDVMVEIAAELLRWRDGALVCKRIIDVDTGAVTTTAVQVKKANSMGTDDPPTRKRPRQDEQSSMLSHIVQVKTEAAQETTRFRDELDNTTLCTLCFENPRDICFAGCGHCLACGACADRLVAQHGGTRKTPCPVCRQPIKRLLPFKLA